MFSQGLEYSQSGELTSLEVAHDVKLDAYNSTYQIDVMAKFRAFASAEFIVLIECKRYRNAVERELVQVLNDKVRSLGAHRGMLFTTSGFQSGAITRHRCVFSSLAVKPVTLATPSHCWTTSAFHQANEVVRVSAANGCLPTKATTPKRFAVTATNIECNPSSRCAL